MERRQFMIGAAALGSLAATANGDMLGETWRDELSRRGAQLLDPESNVYVMPQVHELLGRKGPLGDLARLWIRFAKGLRGRDGLSVEDVVTSDVRCIELELAGLGGDLNTLRNFRASQNEALTDGFQLIEEMLLEPNQQLAEVKIHAEGNNVGSIAGMPPTGNWLAYDVRTLNYFRDGRMALRWDRTNLISRARQSAGFAADPIADAFGCGEPPP